jgi:hypothetical protein
MHPELMRALAIDRQRSLLEDAAGASRHRHGARTWRPSRGHRRSPILARLSIAPRHPAL